MSKTSEYRLIFLFFCCLFGPFINCIAQDALNIAFLTDIHVNPGSPSEIALANIVDEINDANFDVLVLTGDLTNNGSDAELETVKKCLDKLAIPYYAIPGNHETNWSESAGKTFVKLFGNDRFVFSVGNYLFVGFSTGPFLKMGDGHIKKEDLLWLENTLKREMKTGKKLIIASHYPLKDGLDNWFEATEIIKPFRPLLSLCGHEHRLSLHNFDGITGLMGRPSFYKNDTVAGYNIITLKNDSVFVYEKRTGEADRRLFSSFAAGSNDITRNLPAFAKPDYSVNNNAHLMVDAKVVIQDSASIFAGIGWKNNVLVYGNSKGELIAFDYEKQRVVWKNKYQGPVHSSPLVDKNTVYAGDLDGVLHALNINDGTEKWSVATGAPIIGDILLKDGSIYVGGGKDLYRIDAKNGQVKWTFQAEGQLQARPSTDGEVVVFGAWDRHLYCVDVKSGALKWKWNNNRPGILLSPGNVVPAISSGKVFIVAPDRCMTAIDIATGKTIWRTCSHAVRESMGMAADGLAVYAKLMNDSVIAVSTVGEVHKDLWVACAGFGYDHNPCPVVEHNNIVYTATKNGLLTAIDNKTREILFKYKSGNSSINKIMPDDAKGGVWLSTMDGCVVWIQPKTKKTQ